jgi:integrase
VLGRSTRLKITRSSHVRFTAAGFVRSPPLTGRRARVSRRTPISQQGSALPPDPPRTEEIIQVMRCCGDGLHGDRARGLIVVLWRAGLCIQEALDLTELDLDARRGSLLVRRGKGGRRREVGIDDWSFQQLEPWLRARQAMPVGPLLCVIDGHTRGRAWHSSAAREAFVGVWRGPACVGVRRTSSATRMRSSCCARACP